ncbi:LacI family transcriptional regulator, partial [Sinorhizobium medicae]
LLAEGHRKIAFIGDSRTRLAYKRRRAGYDAGLNSAGVPAELRLVQEGDGTLESGRAAVERLFVRDTLPTAFMCVNDQTALGVMIGLKARGYDIPRDFS